MMVSIDNRSGEVLAEDTHLALAEFVLRQEQSGEDTELAISLVSPAEMQELNNTYRGIDAPTDVLAFTNDDELLGDVIICPVIAREHAKEFDSDFESEMALMLTHGILHLLGYTHDSDAEAKTMEARENELLEAWGPR
jgi:probable rRNA maturation factor